MENDIAKMLKEFNKERKQNKGKWIYFNWDFGNGNIVKMKSFNTWVQVLDYNGYRDGGLCDISVKAMNKWIWETLEHMMIGG